MVIARLPLVGWKVTLLLFVKVWLKLPAPNVTAPTVKLTVFPPGVLKVLELLKLTVPLPAPPTAKDMILVPPALPYTPPAPKVRLLLLLSFS